MRQIKLARQIVLFAGAGSAMAHSFHEVFERASSCPDPSFAQCNITGIPSNFCCSTTSTCISLAANTTILCCPSGENCNTIQPVDCNITLQDAGANLDNPIMTTALNVSLPACGGSACCPHGYSCSASGSACLKDTNQSIAPGAFSTIYSTTKSSVPSSTAKSVSTAKSTSITIATSLASSLPLDCNATLVKACDIFPVGAVLVGFFPGVLLGILLSIASICLLGAHRRRSSRRRSGSSFGNKISEPQMQEQTRVDFLRKTIETSSSLAGSTLPGRQDTMHRVRSLFRKSQLNNGNEMQQSPRPPMPLVIKKNQQAQHPVTPPLQRQQSYGEDVNIFADRSLASSLNAQQRKNSLKPVMADPRVSHQTTMDDLMNLAGNLAGLPKGQPYIYRPAYTPTPKTRGT